MSDDEFLKQIEAKKKKGKTKEEQVDLDSMTKRQRMAYLQKQSSAQAPGASSSTVLMGNRKTGFTGASTVTFGQEEHVFYELTNLKSGGGKRGPRPKSLLPLNDDDNDDDDEDDYSSRKPNRS